MSSLTVDMSLMCLGDKRELANYVGVIQTDTAIRLDSESQARKEARAEKKAEKLVFRGVPASEIAGLKS